MDFKYDSLLIMIDIEPHCAHEINYGYDYGGGLRDLSQVTLLETLRVSAPALNGLGDNVDSYDGMIRTQSTVLQPCVP